MFLKKYTGWLFNKVVLEKRAVIGPLPNKVWVCFSRVFVNILFPIVLERLQRFKSPVDNHFY